MLLFYTSPPGKRRNPIAMSDKPKKKITWKQWQRRTMLIILAVVAVFVALYFAVYRQPQPLMEMDCMVGTDAPAAGTITQYSQDNLEGVVFTVSGEEDVADLWQAMQSTQVRLLRGRSVPAPPVGGVLLRGVPLQRRRRLHLQLRLRLLRGAADPGRRVRHPRGERPAPRPGRPVCRRGSGIIPPQRLPAGHPRQGGVSRWRQARKKIGKNPGKFQKDH